MGPAWIRGPKGDKSLWEEMELSGEWGPMGERSLEVTGFIVGKLSSIGE